jgi:hypothetical protein
MINNKFFRQQRQKIQFNVAAVDVEVVQLCNKQILFFFFFISVGCLGQFTRTTTIPHGPLNILQAQ